ncbi:MAG: lipid-A-disaccharide synthase [Synergistales bacterium]|nr:lipid-A-disaccharide synthase [Synergistales bacterium]HOC82079.1 lipid-A-disaccharide synthase [Synergistales bacterium]
MKRVLLLANGPGELWCWARPMIPALGERGFDVSLRLLPCQYASGNEKDIAGGMVKGGVDPPMSVFAALAGKKGIGYDAILQLGGDLLFGLAFSARNRAPLFCYTYGPKPLLNRCDEVFSAFEGTCQFGGAVRDKLLIVGDLVADALAMDGNGFRWTPGGGPRIVLFPGSRRVIRSAALPFIRDLAGRIRERLPRSETVVALSPFSEPGEEEKWRSLGLRAVASPTGSILKGADLAVTQPGTNTLELAYSLVPGIVAVPFAFLRQVPLPGLLGLLGSLPVAGPALKERILRGRSGERGFLAWPNRIAGREILPEMVGDISAVEVADRAVALLGDEDGLRGIRTGLEGIPRSPGAAGRIAARISGLVG